MAKNKKEMTPEERLAAALVPEKEWPYALPDGWKWVRLGKIYEVNPKIQADDNIEASFITMSDICPGIKSQFDFSIKKWGEIKKGHTQFANGDVAFAKISPCFENRKSMILDGLKNGIGAGTTELIVLRNPQIDNNYTFLFISSEEFIRHARNTYKGVVGQQRINLDFVKNYPMPLPPLSEQHRLVARIESLFAKLDAAKAKVQAVLDAHETRKAALLDEAFRGKLTETLDETSTAEDFLDEIYAVKEQLVKEKKLKKPKRLPSMTDEEKPFEIPNTWRWVRFGDILRIINGDRGKNYPSKKELHEAGDIPFISALNIQDNTIATEHLLYVDEERYNLLRSGKLKKGDLVLCIRGSLGKNGRYPFDRGAIASSLVIIRSYLDNDAMSDYISFYLDSLLFKNEMSKYDNGTAQPNLGAGDLSLFAVPLPPLAEQHEIVAILDRLLGREEEVRQSAESVLAAIDSMKQSILARAFHGELGA